MNNLTHIISHQRSKIQVACELVRQSHAALFYACDGGSARANALLIDAWTALDRAAVLLPPDLAETAFAIAVECGETMYGSLGYVITLEQRCDELLEAVCAAVAIEHERKVA